jgi:Replication-relaxation
MSIESIFSSQPRDLVLLRGLFESRIMSGAQIASIYFQGSKEAAKKRLQKVKAAGLIGERKRRISEPAILFLTRKGFSLLKEEGQIADFPRLSAMAFEKRADVSPLTIRHELEVMDVKAAFYSALKNAETSVSPSSALGRCFINFALFGRATIGSRHAMGMFSTDICREDRTSNPTLRTYK